MTELVPFAYGDQPVRTLTIDGEPWFVAADVVRILGYSEAAAMTRTLDDDEKGLRTVQTLGGEQSVSIVSEPGLYSAIIRSRIPEAKTFRRWITHEVIPTIRKTGGYGIARHSRQLPQTFAEALRELASEVEAHEVTKDRVRELDAQIVAEAPKVEYVDTYVADSDLLSLRTLAANLNVKETWLRELLLKREWIYVETATRWSNKESAKVPVNRYSAYSHKRSYFEPKPVHDAPRFKGEVMHTLKVTPAGAAAIAKLVRRELAGLSLVEGAVAAS